MTACIVSMLLANDIGLMHSSQKPAAILSNHHYTFHI